MSDGCGCDLMQCSPIYVQLAVFCNIVEISRMQGQILGEGVTPSSAHDVALEKHFFELGSPIF